MDSLDGLVANALWLCSPFKQKRKIEMPLDLFYWFSICLAHHQGPP